MTKSANKKIIVSVTSDLVSDNRVHKVSTSLHKMGFDVLLVGRRKKNSLSLQPRVYKTHRFKLLFEKGPLFYSFYNIRLFCFLFFSKADIFLANDLDTLPANFLVSIIKKKGLVYDSHEYFTEVPELLNRPRIKKIWESIEQKILPKINHAYTVCDSIAKIYSEKYGTDFKVVRNVPVSGTFTSPENRENTQKIILYQGAVNVGRGLEQTIRAMHYIEDAKFVIAGGGDIKPELVELVQKENLQNKVEFAGLLSFEELTKLTPQADMGLSVEEDLGLNYRFALPNKLFDYIQAEIPVLVTNLPEMAAIVSKYQIGEITSSLEPEILAEKIKKVLLVRNARELWKKNLKTASRELVWEKEEIILREIFQKLQ